MFIVKYDVCSTQLQKIMQISLQLARLFDISVDEDIVIHNAYVKKAKVENKKKNIKTHTKKNCLSIEYNNEN